MWDTLNRFMVQNGQATFGVGVLLMIWFVIVKPELARSRVVITALQDITGTLAAIVGRLEALERLQGHKGETGDRGARGDRGERGEAGDRGEAA